MFCDSFCVYGCHKWKLVAAGKFYVEYRLETSLVGFDLLYNK